MSDLIDGAALTECQHEWVAGIMYVHPEDLDDVARARAEFGGKVECEDCEEIYKPE